MNEFSLDTATKNDGITVRAWHDAYSIRPPSGHYNFKFSWEEAPTREIAEELALAILQKIDLAALPPSASTIFLNEKGEVE